MAIQWPDESIFEPFTIFEELYKTVSDHEIKAAILIPKNLSPGLHPVVFNIHGGFLMTAHSLFAPFFAPWALDLARENSAIIISPDYRLLPSQNGIADQLEDLEDFWQWSHSKLPEVLERNAHGHSLDFTRLLMVGGSAGGYCAVQLALSHPDDITALAMSYPLLDLKDDIFVNGPAPGQPNVLRVAAEQIPSKEDTVAWIEEKRTTVTTKDGFERISFCVGSCQHGLFASKVLDNRNLHRPEFFPLDRIKAGAKLPKKVWIMHGDDDSVVYIRGTQKFANLLKEKLPETTLRFDIAQGEDHAFDFEAPRWKSFAQSALDFTLKAWLGDEEIHSSR